MIADAKSSMGTAPHMNLMYCSRIMVTHPEYGLLVYVDASPSEQLDLKSNDKICIVGAVCGHDGGLPDFHKFGTGRWELKLKRAKALRAAISDESVLLLAIGVSGRKRSLAPWAIDATNQARASLSGVWSSDAKTFTWDGINFPRSQALGAAAYASVLTLIGLGVGDWMKRMEVKHATLILDPLPGQSAEMMKLMRAISERSDLAQGWASTIRRNSVLFRIANMASYADQHDGIEQSAKSHPHAILADWLAASLRAKHDPQSFVDKQDRPRKQEEVEQIAAIWDALVAKRRAKEIDIDNPELLNKLKLQEQANSTN